MFSEKLFKYRQKNYEIEDDICLVYAILLDTQAKLDEHKTFMRVYVAWYLCFVASTLSCECVIYVQNRPICLWNGVFWMIWKIISIFGLKSKLLHLRNFLPFWSYDNETYHFCYFTVRMNWDYPISLKTFMFYLIDVHSYSQLWMTPWGYVKSYPRDYRELVSTKTVM